MGMFYMDLGMGRRLAHVVFEWLLLLSGHKSGEDEEGEGGERRASTRRPARTRHCGSCGV